MQKTRYAIGNVSKKDLSKIIREFEKLPYESYERKRPKHEPTDSYFYPSRQLVKCMIRDYAFNLHVYPVRTKINAPYSHVFPLDESELKQFLVNEPLSQSCFTDEDESKGIISDECSTEDDEYKSKGIIANKFSTEEDKSECVINKQKDEKNEVTYDLPSYFNAFNVFKCGRKLLDILDVSYERACMAPVRE